MYELWLTAELLTAIRDIEEQLVPGVFSVSYSGGGFTQNVSPTEARATCQLMIAALSKRPGYTHLNPGSRGRSITIRMRD
jgi:hypothetical protein